SELADAGLGQLADRERGLRAELGALESARRAERRSREIDAERAGLERQSRADDELIQETAEWLAGWDTTHRTLRERVETAQDAATRAEQLAGRLDPARRRLEAARRRDALGEQEETAAAALTAARESAAGAHEKWLALREQRLRGIAAELAGQLADGVACTVCGSPEHPEPARAEAGHVDRATEEAALTAHQRAERVRTEAEGRLGVLRERLATARAEASDPGEPGPAGGASASVAELGDVVDRLTREHAEAHRLAAQSHAAREALASAEREHLGRLDDRQQAERRTAARTSQREALDREQAALQGELAKARGACASVAEHAGLLERRAGLLSDAADALRAEHGAAERLKEADGRLSDAAYRAGFDTPQAAAAKILGDTAQRELQHRVDAWQTEAATVADRLAEEDAKAAAGRPAADPDAAQAAYDRSVRAVRESAAAYSAAQERSAELGRLSRRTEEEVRALGPVRQEYERVARLAGLTAGTSADNERKMRLEAYVLAARLEQVAAAATIRLQRMSGGRYTLVHSDDRSGGRRAGLGLHVVDSWTGRERDTATLSGGETFFASLALALGLADVVTDEAGGVRLDTLFIDEGFGSLDEQTLDEVLDVLDSLRERDRSVGIVSHVGDLRRRIPAQLEVVKERHGSAVVHRAAGTLSG
ncbi:SbcC/MukB-like Walker B domain-containing protein, partial [[Kitasatospora] papulosa]